MSASPTDRPARDGAAREPGSRDLDPRRARLALIAVLLIAITLRVIYVLQSRASPLFDAPQMDAQYHLEWARAFARGVDFQPGPFFRAPLYPWFLGLSLRIFGDDLLVPRLLQAVIGTASVALVYRIGALVFDRRTGILGALAAATYWMTIYFEGELLLPVLEIAFDLLAIERTLAAGRADSTPSADGSARSRTVLALVAGLAWGAAALVRPNVLAFVPFACFWLWRARPRLGIACAIGCALAIAPIATYNRVVGHDEVLISSQGGVNFYIGNNPMSDGATAIVPGTRPDWWGGYHDAIHAAEVAEGRSLRPSEVSSYYTHQALAWMRAEPAAAWRHLLWKMRLFWTDFELGNNQDERFFALRFGPILRYLPLGFGVVAPLALLGLFLTMRRGWRGFVVWAFVPVYCGTVVAFFVCARYRMPLIPILCLLAAHAGLWIFERARDHDWRRLAPAAVALALVAWGVESVPRAIDRSHAQGWYALGQRAFERGDFAEAANFFHEARAENPRRAVIHQGLGLALVRLGNEADGEASLREAVRLDLRSTPDAAHALIALELRDSRLDEAEALARREDVELPLQALGPYDLGRIAYARGQAADAAARTARMTDALEQFERAATRPLEGDLAFDVPFSLGRAAMELGRAPRAAEAFEAALNARPVPDEEGWTFEAVRALDRALRFEGSDAEAQRRVEAWLARWPDDARTAELRRELLGAH